MILKRYDRIVADAVLLEGQLSTDEATFSVRYNLDNSLTPVQGEVGPVSKSAVDPFLVSGTTVYEVTASPVKAVVVGTGKHCLAVTFLHAHFYPPPFVQRFVNTEQRLDTVYDCCMHIVYWLLR